MHPSLLIDGVVRQFAALIAQLVHATDLRPTLADLPTRVFAEVDDALRRQGVRTSLLAGLFGLKLRTYHDHVRRARETLAQREMPLFGAIYRHVRDEGPVARWALDGAFEQVHPKVLAAVLDDLVASELVYQTGRGPATRYGVVDPADTAARIEAVARLVWVTLYHASPADRARLTALLGDDPDALLDPALDQLIAAGRIEQLPGGDRWRCADYAIPFGDRAGLSAAVLDHVQAVVRTLSAKLGGAGATPSDQVGGSTYTFEVGDGHPFDDEVRALLAETRRRLDALRAAVLEHNRRAPGDGAVRRVVFYVGQHIG